MQKSAIALIILSSFIGTGLVWCLSNRIFFKFLVSLLFICTVLALITLGLGCSARGGVEMGLRVVDPTGFVLVDLIDTRGVGCPVELPLPSFRSQSELDLRCGSIKDFELKHKCMWLYEEETHAEEEEEWPED